MTAAEPDSAPRPRSASSRTPRWARAAAIGACIVLVALLNQFDDCAGYGGLVESAGWPLRFLVHDGTIGATRLVAHGLLLDLFVWAGIIFGVWYATGKHAGKRASGETNERPSGTAPGLGAGADRDA